jgi:serine/threonine protein kinase
VLAEVADLVAELHAAGYVHRDLKPGNVMCLPRDEKWAITDHGCVARLGISEPLRFSLAYAAPEVVRTAMQPDSKGIVADTAFDAWSFGVIAFEILTGERAFGNNALTKDEVRARGLCSLRRVRSAPACVHARAPACVQVIAQLVGEAELPWEGQNLTMEQRGRLGVLRKPVLQMLDRDAARRPSMRAFADKCRSLFK